MLCHFSCVWLFATQWTVAHLAPLAMEFSRQEYWGQLSCPSPGDLPDPGIEPPSSAAPALADGFFITSSTWEAIYGLTIYQRRWEFTLIWSLKFDTRRDISYLQAIVWVYNTNIIQRISLTGNADLKDFPGGPVAKTLHSQCRGTGLDPWSRNSFLENPMDGGAFEGCSPWGHWGLDTTERLYFPFHALEKEMATHSSVLAWGIPGMGEPGGLPSMGSHRADTTEAT